MRKKVTATVISQRRIADGIYDMWIKLLSLMVGLPTIMVFIRTIYYM